MTSNEWVQAAFGLSNIVSFMLTIRNRPAAKIWGSAVLIVAHPTVAAYFLYTGQPYFLLGNVFMTFGGVYGVFRGLRLRRGLRKAAAGERLTQKETRVPVASSMPERGGVPQ